jgi:hypothetical protein
MDRRFPHFGQRNIRQVLIRRLWQSGIDYKLIAMWQGHRDGGKFWIRMQKFSVQVIAFTKTGNFRKSNEGRGDFHAAIADPSRGVGRCTSAMLRR